MVHNLFNNLNEGKMVRNIRCGEEIVCFIDDKDQCYWSPPYGGKNIDGMDIVHFQSLYNGMYRDLGVNYIVSAEDNDANECQFILFDTENRLMLYSEEEEDVVNRLRISEVDLIGPGDRIVNCDWDDELVLFLKKRLRI